MIFWVKRFFNSIDKRKNKLLVFLVDNSKEINLFYRLKQKLKAYLEIDLNIVKNSKSFYKRIKNRDYDF